MCEKIWWICNLAIGEHIFCSVVGHQHFSCHPGRYVYHVWWLLCTHTHIHIFLHVHTPHTQLETHPSEYSTEYHGLMQRDEAELLLGNECGRYMVRENPKGDRILSFMWVQLQLALCIFTVRFGGCVVICWTHSHSLSYPFLPHPSTRTRTHLATHIG